MSFSSNIYSKDQMKLSEIKVTVVSGRTVAGLSSVQNVSLSLQ